MELTVDHVNAALSLSERDRVHLADILYGSLGKGPVGDMATSPLATDFEPELERRSRDMESGDTTGISEEDVHAELDALVEG